MWNKGWDRIFEGNEWGKYPPEELIRFIASNYYNVPKRKSVKILEVGSGTGANLWYFAKEGFDVTGIDGSKVGTKRAAERLKDENLKVKLIRGDIINLPFGNNKFDCVIDNECIYANSYRDSKRILSEIYRVLKPKGKFYSRTFMAGSSGDGNGKKMDGEKNTYLEIFDGPFRKGYGIIRFTSEDEICDLYGDFNIESIDYLMRSKKNRRYDIKEWIIICSKGKNVKRIRRRIVS